ncbi:MAG: hypothetical protein JWR38_3199 [Mucilaginibacter sp.]|nr:hypothetical protein [Mucilaginibacter sp.]
MKKLADRIKEFNKDLLPDMIQLKYKAMLESPFRFFRGTCHLFYEDFASIKTSPDFPLTWICGDLHLENFGSFKGNNRMVYFDLNDFDESSLAFVNWEISRVITSIFVAFDTLKIKSSEATEMAKLFLETYSRTLSLGKARYIDPRTAEGVVKLFLKTVKDRKEKKLAIKQIDSKSRRYKIKIDNKTHFELEKGLKKDLIQHLSDWVKKTKEWPNHYKVIDAAFRVVGTGSIGLKRYLFLLQSIKNDGGLLLMDMKQGVKSSLAPYNPVPQPNWDSQATRVISVKYRMQNISPALLSTTVFKDNAYVLQEMQSTADKINFASIDDQYQCLKQVITDMAVLTASAQIRSGGIQKSATIDELMAFGKRTNWQEPLLKYAIKYAKQVKKDYNQFKSDYNSGVYSTPA